MHAKVTRRVISSDIDDSTVVAVDIAADSIVTSKIADGTITGDKIKTKTIETDKLTYRTQSGSLVVTSSGAYKSFAVPYSSPPQVVITPMTGSIDSFAVSRVVEGSFMAWGSPTGKYFSYVAFGSA